MMQSLGNSYAMSPFDLNLLPVIRLNGQEFASMPGLIAVTPPRKPARGREKDYLILYLMTSGNADIPPEEIDKLLNDAAGLFHQTSGSLTSAMKKVAERINSSLLERNLSSSRRGLYATGTFVALAIKSLIFLQ